ncbi:MAG TPA: P1 family peptidase [Casimicrobiaceae bacterium]|nr:P1 family peptidase [Casimicrobiaceae bacterium]
MAITRPTIGALASGASGTIADVDGVTVGHCTVAQDALQTGVTVVRPHARDPFREKVPAAAVVINGFGKSAGIMQVNELGVLETPIALTNTFAVGTIATAQIRVAVDDNPGIARTTTSINPLVFECSDAYLSDMQSIGVGEEHYRAALAAATATFERGSIGAGRGMSCFELKGGIGTASRMVSIVGRPYAVGVLVLANFGRLPNLTIAGRHIGPRLVERLKTLRESRDTGSVIVVIATDAPLDHRQLRRIAMRGAAGIGRTGAYFGHGSGDIALAFSTAATVPHDAPRSVLTVNVLVESLLEALFDATAEATEAAIVDALFSATTVVGFQGHVRHALADIAPDWIELG